MGNNNLLQKIRLTDTEKYFNYLRMSSETFQILLNIVGPKLTKIYNVGKPIPDDERLLTLRYSVRDCLNQKVLLTPTANSWFQISENFNEKWQLPHCVGAIDEKHVIIEGPKKSGTTFYDYKGSFSIVLLAMCDAMYRFIFVDIGAEFCHSDGGIFRNSKMEQLINSNGMHFPEASPVGNKENVLHKECRNVNTFKVHVKNYLVAMCLYSISDFLGAR